MTNASLENIGLDQKTWENGENVVIGSFNIQLTQPTPQNVGVYPYRLILKNNSYFGVDLDIPVFLDVKSPPPVAITKEKLLGKKQKGDEDEDEDEDSDSDISDPEEDSLAGALAALRGAPVKKLKKSLKKMMKMWMMMMKVYSLI